MFRQFVCVSLSGLIALTMSVGAHAASGFTLTGNVPGLKAGSKIKLVSRDIDSHGTLAEGTASDGAFVLTGEVGYPTVCELRIDPAGSDGSMGKAINLMVENLPMAVSAADIDSIPPSFYFGSAELKREKNVTVTGGQAQKEFAEYNAAMLPYTVAAKDAHYACFIDEDRDRTPEGKARLAAAVSAANRAEKEAHNAFVAAHPHYSIAGRYLVESLSTPFGYTPAELDAIAASVAGMPDAPRRSQVEKAIERSRKFPRESMFTDVVALDTLGAERSLSEFAGKGKYVLVDFWASWCGPCRAAIPHVRELYNRYGDRLDILAVSLDSAEKPWRKAMEQEGMEWMQLWADKNHAEPISSAYQVRSIPFIMLLDPEGRIVNAGHDPDAATAAIEKALGK